ncbi:MAG: hypothetical protein NE330_15620, partial [Lentisphaeraceae bacterium]|nr:hypothetical protein [Lentisphaeraceae bacterium]
MIKKLALTLGVSCALSSANAEVDKSVDFIRDVKPVLEFNCVSCHQATKAKGKLRIDTYEEMMKGASGDAVIVSGKPEESTLYTTTVLDADDDDVMPPTKNHHVMSKFETDILKEWIKTGAKWPKGEKLVAQKH